MRPKGKKLSRVIEWRVRPELWHEWTLESDQKWTSIGKVKVDGKTVNVRTPEQAKNILGYQEAGEGKAYLLFEFRFRP